MNWNHWKTIFIHNLVQGQTLIPHGHYRILSSTHHVAMHSSRGNNRLYSSCDTLSDTWRGTRLACSDDVPQMQPRSCWGWRWCRRGMRNDHKPSQHTARWKQTDVSNKLLICADVEVTVTHLKATVPGQEWWMLMWLSSSLLPCTWLTVHIYYTQVLTYGLKIEYLSEGCFVAF